MSPIPKPILSALLIFVGLVGVSGCASKNAEIASLRRLLAAQQERIEALQLTKADMQRIIDLKQADIERENKARLLAERERDLRPAAVPGSGALSASHAPINQCYVRVLSTPGSHRVSERVAVVTHRVQTGDRAQQWQPAWCQTHATSATVRQVQAALKQRYYYHGPLDGVYGSQTRRAIAAYQRAEELAMSGMTFETLQSLGLQTPDQHVTVDVR